VRSSGIFQAIEEVKELIPTKTSELENDSEFVDINHGHPAEAISYNGSTVKDTLDEMLGGGYLLKYTVPNNVALVSLSIDKNGNPFDFKEGEMIEIYVYATYENTITGTGNLAIRVNNVTNEVYRTSNFTAAGLITAFFTDNDFRKMQRVNARYILVGTELQGNAAGHAITTANAPIAANLISRTEGLNALSISSIQFMARPNQDRDIGAGSIIIIKKL
jgi:hypothetical protein